MSTGKWLYPPAKAALTDALFSLMKTKSYEQISVSDIIKKAHVARTTFYRNFNTKEDIIKDYLAFLKREMLGFFENTPLVTEDFYSYMNPKYIENLMIFAFNTCKRERNKILCLVNNGLDGMILNIMSFYSESIIAEEDVNTLYKAFFIQGAAFNMMVQWLKLDAKETPEVIAHRFIHYISDGI